MTTPSPNEQNPRKPDADPEHNRNDYGIDPEDELPEGTENTSRPDKGNTAGDSTGSQTAEGNAFSPDFKPEEGDDDRGNRAKPKDGDIDTDGG